ncbi:MAG: HAMP domain-containing histidine kinase [Piscirickettsiaceae bacterium]|nr:HAMP domain-containing histidine kinase [Piscirickettsiaceae bacterium]
MKRQLSLKLFISISFLILAMVIIVTYSFLSAHFFFRGMDNIIASNLEKAGYSFIHSRTNNTQNTVTHFNHYTITYDWQQLPNSIRKEFEQPPQRVNVLYKIDTSSWFERPDVIHFIMRLQIDDEDFFIYQSMTKELASEIVVKNIKESMNTLFFISVSILFLIAFFIWLLLKRIAQPVYQLNQWTHQLDSHSLTHDIPDFSYPELNEMARVIQCSLSSVQESLKREERFLSYASHELRTPISIIRNNIELLNKLKHTSITLNESKLTQIIKRIDRASLTMKHLSETLLWLSRDITEPLPKQEVDLELLVKQTNSEMVYLLNNKVIDLTLLTQSHPLYLAEIPARIILGNLIRNAFQHTTQGQISIQQSNNTVIIINPTSTEDPNPDLGFGLGLQLTKQLADKLGWSYKVSHSNNIYRVEVKF